jgi:hypothetical protein
MMKIILFPLSFYYIFITIVLINLLAKTNFLYFYCNDDFISGLYYIIILLPLALFGLLMPLFSIIHEITHAMFCVICFVPIVHIKIWPHKINGRLVWGSVNFDDDYKCPKIIVFHLVYLSPYFFPLLPFMLVGLSFIFIIDNIYFYIGIAYALYISHFVTCGLGNVPDFVESVGTFYGLAFCVMLNIVFFMILMALMDKSIDAYAVFISNISNFYDSYHNVKNYIFNTFN